MGPENAQASPLRLKPHLDQLYTRFDRSFLEPDPLAALSTLTDPADMEIAAVFAAMFAYGRAELIQKTVTKIILAMEGSPAAFCAGFRPGANRSWMKGFKYRFHNRDDLAALVAALGKAQKQHGSMLGLFLEGDDGGKTVFAGVSAMARRLREYATKSPAFATLVTDPADGSACKRWMLYMRWMVRRDGVDPGPWSRSVDKSRLVIPLDTHVGRIARFLGMLTRNSNDWKAAVELTDFLRRLDPDDPVRYDFAICSYGKLGYCTTRPAMDKCQECGMAGLCSAAVGKG
ncbi:MAG: TIGR02757 family protein [Nitrospinota bacterium]|nr:TIGR02757 family protein [Nitrospinota bacterium]